MNDVEFAKFIVEDTMRYVVQAVAIYGVLLGVYWLFIG